jgi:hypothetical protein
MLDVRRLGMMVLTNLTLLAFLAGKGMANEVLERKPMTGPFYFIGEGQYWDCNFLMSFPNRKVSQIDAAVLKLKETMKGQQADTMASMHICREAQIPGLKKLAPLVDQASINPYVY